jgi:hypothetical protein
MMGRGEEKHMEMGYVGRDITLDGYPLFQQTSLSEERSSVKCE